MVMFKRLLSGISIGAALAAGSAGAAAPAFEPVYIVDGQYTAVLEQHAHRWRMLPLRGDEIDVTDRSTACGSSTPIPNGLWYVTQDVSGQALLVAPSMTTLPAGFPNHVPLRVCGESATADATLFVPAVALAWINSNVGTVKIDD
jgi:hypothetical protein